MAGSFGLEAEHYDVSMRIGELGVLPKMRAAAPDTLLAACGTSCRHQIAEGAGREARHIVRILDEASRLEYRRFSPALCHPGGSGFAGRSILGGKKGPAFAEAAVQACRRPRPQASLGETQGMRPNSIPSSASSLRFLAVASP